MISDTKKASNDRYLSKFKAVSVRVPNERLEELTEAASGAGESLAGYILNAAFLRANNMKHADVSENETNGMLTDTARAIAAAAADLDGKTIPEWIEKAVIAQQAADARVNQLRRDMENMAKSKEGK